jgi:hypothetical protein
MIYLGGCNTSVDKRNVWKIINVVSQKKPKKSHNATFCLIGFNRQYGWIASLSIVLFQKLFRVNIISLWNQTLRKFNLSAYNRQGRTQKGATQDFLAEGEGNMGGRRESTKENNSKQQRNNVTTTQHYNSTGKTEPRLNQRTFYWVSNHMLHLACSWVFLR